MKVATALALAAGLTLVGCSTETPTHAAAAAPKSHGQQCFRARDVSSFSFVNDDVVNIRVGVSDYYRLELLTSCTGSAFVEGAALRTTGGADFVCSPLDVELTIPNPSGPVRCPVSAIHKLTPDEVAALDPKQKP